MQTEISTSNANDIKKNSILAWVLAFRPRTLSAGSIPVIVASALAYRDGSFRWVPALLCLFFSLLAQIASNLANDYFDYRYSSDSHSVRLGPARAVSSGWISPKAMLFAIVAVIILASIFGLGLIYYGGWEMIIVGIICVVSLIAYSAGPYPLSRNGLGDVFVLVFFGWVATAFTYYVQTIHFTPDVFLAGTIVGLGAVNILVLNNYRDYPTDLSEGKRTTVVIFGLRFGRVAYLTNGILATILCIFLMRNGHCAYLLSLLSLPVHIKTWYGICHTKGVALNRYLGLTSRNLLLLGLLITLGNLISK